AVAVGLWVEVGVAVQVGDTVKLGLGVGLRVAVLLKVALKVGVMVSVPLMVGVMVAVATSGTKSGTFQAKVPDPVALRICRPCPGSSAKSVPMKPLMGE